jgi:hypothetical protein
MITCLIVVAIFLVAVEQAYFAPIPLMLAFLLCT